MTNEEFYGENHTRLKRTQRDILNILNDLKEDYGKHFMYISTRIKTADSSLEKMHRKNISKENLYEEMSDIIGFRIICPFQSDIYFIVNKLKECRSISVIEEKNYLKNPKPSGYQSYHLIIKAQNGQKAEVQIRTIALDFWAALEHKLRYKKDIKNEELIAEELQRVAKNISSLDSDMETLRELIVSEVSEPKN